MTRTAATHLAIVAGVVVLLDQLSKLLALARLAPGTPLPVIDGVLSLTLVMNRGLAFGLLGGVPPGFGWIVVLLSVAALVVLVRVALHVLPRGGVIDHGTLGLIFGGAVGNLIDRWRFGAVVDFVDVYYRAWHWPAFNVADSAISVGVVLLALRLMTERGERPV
jgi:signal peptidase II